MKRQQTLEGCIHMPRSVLKVAPRWILVLGGLLCATTAGASHTQDVGRLLRASGFSAQVAMIPDAIQDTVGRAGMESLEVPVNKRDALQLALVESFSVERLNYQVGNTLRHSLSNSDVQTLLAWYRSEQGQRITEAEITGSSPGSWLAMQAMTSQLLQDSERLNAVQRISRSVNAVEFASHLTVAGYSVQAFMENSSQILDIEQLSSQMAAQVLVAEENLQMMVWLSFLYAYRELDLQTLQRYAEFLEEPSSTRFNDLAMGSLRHVMLMGVRNMALASTRIMPTSLSH